MPTAQRVLLTGATGYLGPRLLPHLTHPVVLSRDAACARSLAGHAEAHAWTPEAGPPPAAALEGVDAVVHLAGEPVAGLERWTPEKKARIRDSRVLGTRHLVEGLRRLERRPAVLVCGSAVGVYGERGEEPLTEASAPGSGFWAEVCRAWEEEALAARALGVRVVCARIGLVLGDGPSFLAKQLAQARLGLGGTIGHGRQQMPWVHVEDVVGLLLHALRTPTLEGPLNVTAPQPVSNRDFTRTLAGLLRRPAWLRQPRWLLRAAMGEMVDALVVSQRVLPEVAVRTGYAFRYPQLTDALRALVGPGAGAR